MSGPSFELGTRLELHVRVNGKTTWAKGTVVKLTFHTARLKFDDSRLGTIGFSYDSEWRKA
jgi:hypothetical protein